MHIYFRRIGTTEYLNITAEDRTDSADHPRTYRTTSKTFNGLDALLSASESAGVNRDGIMDLHTFVNQASHASEASSGEMAISSEELEGMGFPTMERVSRVYLVSITVDNSDRDQILVQARMQNAPPGIRTPEHQRVFNTRDLEASLAVIDRKIADLHDRRLGPDVPKKAKLDEEDLHTLWTWKV
jgi:hypothetical protein